ncbi:MAG: N-acetyltransferase, partial [Draconibacterium sp.]
MNKEYYAHETAIVDKGAKIGTGTKIWHFSHVMGTAEIGKNCVLGQNVFVGN